MSVDTMHSLFKTGERFLQLTHQLLNPPFQMQPTLLDELLADPDARLSALLNAILDGIVALESQAALDEDPAADTMSRNNAFPNPTLPITRRSTPPTTGETSPLPAPFRTAYQDASRLNSSARQTSSPPAPPISPGLLQTLADLNIPLPGTRQSSGALTSNELNWPSTPTPDNRNRFGSSDVPDIEHPTAGQVASENSSPARMRLPSTEQSQVGRSNLSDSPALPRIPTGKPEDRRFERQAPTQWPGSTQHEVTGAPVGDNYGQANNVTGQTGWDTTSEREVEAARLPHIETDVRPVVSRSVSGAAKIASVLRANISNPFLPQQGSPEFAGYEFAENEWRDLEAGEIGAKAGEAWAKHASPLQRQMPTAANSGESSIQRERLPDSAHEKTSHPTNAVDLEKLVEQLADYLEFEFQRTYGTSGGAL